MSTDIKVRVGVPSDLEQVMDLGRMIHQEIAFSSYNPERVLPDVYAALHQDHGIMGLIGEPGGELQAGILLRIGQAFYSDEDVLEDRGLFVRPEHRTASRQAGHGRQPHAVMLCEFAKVAAEALGLKLFIGVQSNVNTEGKLKLYERQFGAPVGAFFLYTPSSVAKSEAS